MSVSNSKYEATKIELDTVVEAIGQIMLGKEEAVRLSLACVLAQGHLLIEDMPGLGKTTLAHTLAIVLGLEYQRIQFTSDLLPADILGVSVYNRESATFSFHRGPIFSQLILADEINRATPRAQSALLEAMSEDQVTIEGTTYNLPTPFFVIATQNPSNQVGTFPLPESQLDRFTMCINLGYPDRDAERKLMQSCDRHALIKQIHAVINVPRLIEMQQQAGSIHVSEALLDYLQNILEYSRLSNNYAYGLSPRAGLAVLQCARAWALIHGHAQVLPEDIQRVLPSVTDHRLSSMRNDDRTGENDLIKQVPIP